MIAWEITALGFLRTFNFKSIQYRKRGCSDPCWSEHLRRLLQSQFFNLPLSYQHLSDLHRKYI